MDRARRPGRPLPLLTIGFRPFYLLAGAFAAVGVPVWHFAPGALLPGVPYLAGGAWHAHEMVFGFAVAVLAGFLLTTTRAWTGLATPAGWRLAALLGAKDRAIGLVERSAACFSDGRTK